MKQDLSRWFRGGSQVFSYHVNVGLGNYSFLLLVTGNFYQLWLVDVHWYSLEICNKSLITVASMDTPL